MKYVCQICGYIYDEAKEPVAFADLDDDWRCPLCGAPKSDFAAEVVQPAVAASAASMSAEATPYDPDAEKLSAGQLSALCSNLSRGCEKQYKTEESALFQQLADYFAAVTPAIEDATVERVAALLQADVDSYAGVRATADAAEDRGAARVCAWGEKVTRMLSSLVNRYMQEGEPMLADANIWVCTVCGFVYIGQDAPRLCPVCKVPDWKFEKMEGR